MTKLLKRKPNVADTIRTHSGHDYVVERIYTTPGIRGVHFYEVVDAATGSYPNTIEPREVAGVVS